MRTIALSLAVSLLGAALPALAQPNDAGKEIRVTGCLQWEQDHTRKDHDFVLTMVKPEGERKATTYSITGDRAKELGRRVGQQVEVIGVLDNEKSDQPSIKLTGWVPVKDSCAR